MCHLSRLGRLLSATNQSLALVDRLSQKCFDLLFPSLWVLWGLMTRDNLPAAINDKVGKIPLDAATATSNGIDHPIVQIESIVAVDVDFRHHVESNSVLFFDVSLNRFLRYFFLELFFDSFSRNRPLKPTKLI